VNVKYKKYNLWVLIFFSGVKTENLSLVDVFFEGFVLNHQKSIIKILTFCNQILCSAPLSDTTIRFVYLLNFQSTIVLQTLMALGNLVRNVEGNNYHSATNHK